MHSTLNLLPEKPNHFHILLESKDTKKTKIGMKFGRPKDMAKANLGDADDPVKNIYRDIKALSQRREKSSYW